MKTLIAIEVEHKDDMDVKRLTEMIAQRAYTLDGVTDVTVPREQMRDAIPNIYFAHTLITQAKSRMDEAIDIMDKAA